MKQKRLIDADALLLRVDCHGTNKFGVLDEDIREFIRKQPTIDAVEVVRCRDCKYRSRSHNENGFYMCDALFVLVSPGAYCAVGERTEEPT